MTNRVDTELSDLGLHCLPRPVSPKSKDHYGSIEWNRSFSQTRNGPQVCDTHSRSSVYSSIV